MTTRKEDAASIIGEELADELDEKAKLVGKSQALVIKSEDEPEDEPEDVEDEPEVEPELELVEEAKSSKKDEEEMDDEEDDEDCADGKKKGMKKSMIDERLDRIEEMLSKAIFYDPSVKQDKYYVSQEVNSHHELDEVFSQFKSDYDSVKAMNVSTEEKLRMLQESSNRIGEEVRNKIIITPEPEVNPEAINSNDLVQQLSLAMSNAMQPIASKLDLLLTQQTDNMVKSKSETPAIPVRRSIAPTLSMQKDIKQVPQIMQKQSETPKLRALLEQNLKRATPQ